MVSFVRSVVRRYVPENVRTALLKRFDFLAYGMTLRTWITSKKRRYWSWSEDREHIIRRTDDLLTILDRRMLRLDAAFIDKAAWFDEMLQTKDDERWRQVEIFNQRSDDLLKLVDQRFARLEAKIAAIEGSHCSTDQAPPHAETHGDCEYPRETMGTLRTARGAP